MTTPIPVAPSEGIEVLTKLFAEHGLAVPTDVIHKAVASMNGFADVAALQRHLDEEEFLRQADAREAAQREAWEARTAELSAKYFKPNGRQKSAIAPEDLVVLSEAYALAVQHAGGYLAINSDGYVGFFVNEPTLLHGMVWRDEDDYGAPVMQVDFLPAAVQNCIWRLSGTGSIIPRE